jgi:hypothetical protein
MPITIDGNGIITGAATLATTVANPTFTTPNINSAQFATVSGTAPIYPCRAWVNFNGTGTVAIRASGNVTSITDNGAGLYAVNMTNAMPDANYCVTLAKQNPAATNMTDIGVHNSISGSITTVAPTTSSFSVMLNQSAVDSAYVMCAVFR